MSGLIIGLSFTLWISFGGPRPSPPVLPVGTCDNAQNSTVPVLHTQNGLVKKVLKGNFVANFLVL